MRSAQGSPKPDGTDRPLGIPTELDRVIQQAIAQVLTPLWDGEFSENSYGFREGRNAHQAVRQVEVAWKLKRRHAVDCDLKAFFVVNRIKSKCAPLAECEFLGFKISKQGKVKWAEKSIKRFKQRVKEWERSGHRVSGGEPREG